MISYKTLYSLIFCGLQAACFSSHAMDALTREAVANAGLPPADQWGPFITQGLQKLQKSPAKIMGDLALVFQTYYMKGDLSRLSPDPILFSQQGPDISSLPAHASEESVAINWNKLVPAQPQGVDSATAASLIEATNTLNSDLGQLFQSFLIGALSGNLPADKIIDGARQCFDIGLSGKVCLRTLIGVKHPNQERVTYFFHYLPMLRAFVRECASENSTIAVEVRLKLIELFISHNGNVKTCLGDVLVPQEPLSTQEVTAAKDLSPVLQLISTTQIPLLTDYFHRLKNQNGTYNPVNYELVRILLEAGYDQSTVFEGKTLIEEVEEEIIRLQSAALVGATAKVFEEEGPFAKQAQAVQRKKIEELELSANQLQTFMELLSKQAHKQ